MNLQKSEILPEDFHLHKSAVYNSSTKIEGKEFQGILRCNWSR